MSEGEDNYLEELMDEDPNYEEQPKIATKSEVRKKYSVQSPKLRRDDIRRDGEAIPRQ